MTAYARVWRLLVAVLCGLGLLEALLAVRPVMGPASAGIAAGSVAAMVAVTGRTRRELASTIALVAPHAAFWAVQGAAATGLGALAGAPAVQLQAVLLCCHPRLVHVLRLALRRRTSTAVPASDERWPDAAAVGRLSTAELCLGWRASSHALERTSPRTDRCCWLGLVGLRARYLDELADREPAGIARWLRSGAGPAGDPRPFLAGPSDGPRPAGERHA